MAVSSASSRTVLQCSKGCTSCPAKAAPAHCQTMGASAALALLCSAAGVKHSAAYVQGLVDKEIAAGIAANRILVAGFSQGGHLALKTALFSPQRLAGCVALSTWLEPLKDQVMGCSQPCLYGAASAHLADIPLKRDISFRTRPPCSGSDCSTRQRAEAEHAWRSSICCTDVQMPDINSSYVCRSQRATEPYPFLWGTAPLTPCCQAFWHKPQWASSSSRASEMQSSIYTKDWDMPPMPKSWMMSRTGLPRSSQKHASQGTHLAEWSCSLCKI